MKYMKVLYISNYPSPYRVDFFNLLGQKVDLTVSFTERPEEQRHRAKAWFHTNYDHFKAVFLKKKIGKIFFDIIPLIKKGWDYIILGGYSTPTLMLAIEYMRLRRIPFAIEADGGLLKREGRIKYQVKRHFIRSASAWFSSGKTTTDYFLHYGAKKEKIYFYPFSSLLQRDLDKAKELMESKAGLHRNFEKTSELKKEYRHVVLSIGQFIHRKGFDILIKAAAKLPADTGIYIIGGSPTEEYIALVDQFKLNNVYFLGFKTKDELRNYFLAADVFAMPTREDIWGLVINEALSYGLPVVSTDRCVAALEMIQDGVNGYIVPVEDVDALASGIEKVLASDSAKMKSSAYNSVRQHTIENMVEAHVKVIGAH